MSLVYHITLVLIDTQSVLLDMHVNPVYGHGKCYLQLTHFIVGAHTYECCGTLIGVLARFWGWGYRNHHVIKLNAHAHNDNSVVQV